MNFNQVIKDINLLVKAISGKDCDVFVTYRTGLGITKHWNIKCDVKEADHETHEGAALILYNSLLAELRKRIEMTETQAENYRSSLKSILNRASVDFVIEKIAPLKDIKAGDVPRGLNPEDVSTDFS